MFKAVTRPSLLAKGDFPGEVLVLLARYSPQRSAHAHTRTKINRVQQEDNIMSTQATLSCLHLLL